MKHALSKRSCTFPLLTRFTYIEKQKLETGTERTANETFFKTDRFPTPHLRPQPIRPRICVPAAQHVEVVHEQLAPRVDLVRPVEHLRDDLLPAARPEEVPVQHLVVHVPVRQPALVPGDDLETLLDKWGELCGGHVAEPPGDAALLHLEGFGTCEGIVPTRASDCFLSCRKVCRPLFSWACQ